MRREEEGRTAPPLPGQNRLSHRALGTRFRRTGKMPSEPWGWRSRRSKPKLYAAAAASRFADRTRSAHALPQNVAQPRSTIAGGGVEWLAATLALCRDELAARGLRAVELARRRLQVRAAAALAHTFARDEPPSLRATGPEDDARDLLALEAFAPAKGNGVVTGGVSWWTLTVPAVPARRSTVRLGDCAGLSGSGGEHLRSS